MRDVVSNDCGLTLAPAPNIASLFMLERFIEYVKGFEGVVFVTMQVSRCGRAARMSSPFQHHHLGCFFEHPSLPSLLPLGGSTPIDQPTTPRLPNRQSRRSATRSGPRRRRSRAPACPRGSAPWLDPVVKHWRRINSRCGQGFLGTPHSSVDVGPSQYHRQQRRRASMSLPLHTPHKVASTYSV